MLGGRCVQSVRPRLILDVATGHRILVLSVHHIYVYACSVTSMMTWFAYVYSLLRFVTQATLSLQAPCHPPCCFATCLPLPFTSSPHPTAPKSATKSPLSDSDDEVTIPCCAHPPHLGLCDSSDEVLILCPCLSFFHPPPVLQNSLASVTSGS
jgi:hypothetical protein